MKRALHRVLCSMMRLGASGGPAALVALCWLAVTGPARAADVTVTVTGTVRDNTCVVAGRGLLLVRMGHATNIRDLQTEGATGKPVPFTLTLQHCGAVASGVAVTFTGDTSAGNPDVLTLENVPGSATGVGVQLLDQNQTPLNIGSASPVFALQASEQEVDLTLYARYIATATGATAGRAWAHATASFTYQ